MVRSANTARLARDLNDHALGLAKANLQNANLEQRAKEEKRRAEDLMSKIQVMEAALARGMTKGID